MKSINRRPSSGFVMAVLVMTLLLIALFLFTYNFLVRTQNREIHHGAVSETASMLSLNGVNFLADSLYFDNADKLKGEFLKYPASGKLFELWNRTTPADIPFPPQLLAEIKKEFEEKCLVSYPDMGFGQPKCTEMTGRIFSRAIFPLTTPNSGNLSGFLQAGYDAVEKEGEAVLTCTVDVLGLKRTAQVKRHFKVVSMIPGPYCRFSLFCLYTPKSEIYNKVQNNYDGSFDRRRGSYYQPLVVTNSEMPRGGFPEKDPENGLASQSISPTDFLRTKKLLSKRGWLYLGETFKPGEHPSPDNPSVILLNIPSGYRPNPGVTPPDPESGIGGDFLFGGLPAPNERGLLTNPAYQVDSGGNLDPNRAALSAIFKGFWTFEPTYINPSFFSSLLGSNLDANGLRERLNSAPRDSNNLGAVSYSKDWKVFSRITEPGTPLDLEKSFSTWVMPFGYRYRISPTLAFGKIFAQYLSLKMINISKSYIPGIPVSLVLLPPPKDSECIPLIKPFEKFCLRTYPPIEIFPGDRNQKEYQDFFQNPVREKTRAALPTVSADGGDPYFQGMYFLPLNLLYDFCLFPGSCPDPDRFKSNAEAGIGKLMEPGYSYPVRPLSESKSLDEFSCIQATCGVTLWHYNETANRSDETIKFSGDLHKCFFDLRRTPGSPPDFGLVASFGLIPRVTKFIDLSSATENFGSSLKEVLKTRVFNIITFNNEKVYEFVKPGIFLFNLPKGRDLEIDLPVHLRHSGIIVLMEGNIIVKHRILDTGSFPRENPILAGRKPRNVPNLFSLVALAGDIRIPNERIDAYLVALSKNKGGRVLALEPNNVANRVNVRGGMAVFQLASDDTGESTMENFRGGGMLAYNSYFNPSRPVYDEKDRHSQYWLVFDEKNSEITFRGAE